MNAPLQVLVGRMRKRGGRGQVRMPGEFLRQQDVLGAEVGICGVARREV